MPLRKWQSWVRVPSSLFCSYFVSTTRMCRNVSASSGRLLRKVTVVRDWNRENGLEGTPAGLQVDHIVPLCLEGPDCRCNLQYISIEGHYRKTLRDVAACRFFNVKLWDYKAHFATKYKIKQPRAADLCPSKSTRWSGYLKSLKKKGTFRYEKEQESEESSESDDEEDSDESEESCDEEEEFLRYRKRSKLETKKRKRPAAALKKKKSATPTKRRRIEKKKASPKKKKKAKQVKWVYLSHSGDCFHREGCEYLSKSMYDSKRMLRTKAGKMGKGPCSHCQPWTAEKSDKVAIQPMKEKWN